MKSTKYQITLPHPHRYNRQETYRVYEDDDGMFHILQDIETICVYDLEGPLDKAAERILNCKSDTYKNMHLSYEGYCEGFNGVFFVRGYLKLAEKQIAQFKEEYEASQSVERERKEAEFEKLKKELGK